MRVLVTRPQADAARTAARLAARGHEAVVAPVPRSCRRGERLRPCVRRRRPDERPRAAGPAAVLGTAAAGLRGGARTGAAAPAAGFAQVRAAGGDARALWRALVAAIPPPARPAPRRRARPQGGAGGVPTRAGYRVQVWEAYEARAAARLPDNLPPLLKAGRIDAALHYSRRSAGLFVELCTREGCLPAFRALAHVCLSADVAIPLRGVGVDPVIAAAPDEESLVAALDSFGPPPGSPPSAP